MLLALIKNCSVEITLMSFFMERFPMRVNFFTHFPLQKIVLLKIFSYSISVLKAHIILSKWNLHLQVIIVNY